MAKYLDIGKISLSICPSKYLYYFESRAEYTSQLNTPIGDSFFYEFFCTRHRVNDGKLTITHVQDESGGYFIYLDFMCTM
mgnify:FL=1